MVLDRAYIWNKVHIANKVKVQQSVICDGVEVKQGVTLNEQCVLAYNVRNLEFLLKNAITQCFYVFIVFYFCVYYRIVFIIVC